MLWSWLKSASTPRTHGRRSFFRRGPEAPLQRLIRLIVEEAGVHAFIHRATADREVVQEAKSMTRLLLQGQEISDQCRALCLRFGVAEPLLRARLWAVASFFSDQPTIGWGPYQILGVDPWATPESIKRAFHALCLRWHPDLNQGNPESKTRFLQIKAAYDMLAESASTIQRTPLTACVWEEGVARDSSPSVWARMRLLMPLGFLVATLLILAVGFSDSLISRLRPTTVARDVAVGLHGKLANVPVPPGVSTEKEPLYLPVLDDNAAVAVAFPDVLRRLPDASAGLRSSVREADVAGIPPVQPPNILKCHPEGSGRVTGHHCAASTARKAGSQSRDDKAGSVIAPRGNDNPALFRKNSAKNGALSARE